VYFFLAYILLSVLLASWFSGSISGINLGETYYCFKYFFCFISLYSPYYTYVISFVVLQFSNILFFPVCFSVLGVLLRYP